MTDRRLGSMVIEDSGDGPAVVFVHGLGGSSNTFETMMPAVAGFRVLRPDLPGAGRSPYRPGRPGLGALVSALRDGLLAAGVDRAHFVGHSMGTLVCQHLAVACPDMVRSLVLFGAITEPPVAARQALRERAAAARDHGMAGIADAVSSGSVAEASRNANPVTRAFVRESLMRQDPGGYAAHCEALAGAEPADHGAIACRTLIVAGERDPVAPVAMGREMAGRIGDAGIEEIPAVGHWMMIEAIEKTNGLLRDHLAAQAGEHR